MKENIQEMFDSIAHSYDKLNNIISLGQHLNIKKRAIKNVPLKSNSKVLDVCTGTGDIAIYLAKNVVSEGSVVGVDFCEHMLEIAKTKIKEIGNIEFIKADALNLPFNDEEFDACFISFGLRNLTDLKKGLQEMERVVKKGGFVVNIDTGKPKGIFNIFKILHNIYFFHVVPLISRLFMTNASAYKYLPQSTIDFPEADELVRIFEEIGLTNVKKFDFLFGAISEQIGQQ